VAAGDGDSFAWLQYREASREEPGELVGLLGLHALSIDDFPDNVFVLFNTFQYIEGVQEVGEINLFVGQRFLVSISHLDARQRSYLDEVEKMVERGIEEARQGPSHLMHLILDHVVDLKFVAIESLEDERNGVEEALMADPARFKPAELIRFRRYLLRLRKSLFTNGRSSARSAGAISV
jgi:magnesium transporter